MCWFHYNQCIMYESQSMMLLMKTRSFITSSVYFGTKMRKQGIALAVRKEQKNTKFPFIFGGLWYLFITFFRSYFLEVLKFPLARKEVSFWDADKAPSHWLQQKCHQSLHVGFRDTRQLPNHRTTNFWDEGVPFLMKSNYTSFIMQLGVPCLSHEMRT